MRHPRTERQQDAERRRKLAEAFGEPLPEETSDESAEGWGERSSGEGGGRDEEWLRRQVPPHHG